MRHLSTRTRLILVVVLASLPLVALTVYVALEQRAAASARAHAELQMLVKLAARHQGQIVEGARQTLVAASQAYQYLQTNQGVCDDYFRGLLQLTGGAYQSAGLYDTAGEPFCSAIPVRAPFNVRDRLYFRLAMEHGRFAIGEYQVSRLTGAPGVNFGYPVIDDGEVRGVSFVSLDLAHLQEVAGSTPLPRDGVLIVVDGTGTTLARFPENQSRIGQRIRNPEVLQAIVSGTRGVFEGLGTDGVQRLFAFDTVATNPDGIAAIKVSLSIPTRVIFEDANRTLMLSLSGILVASLLLLLAAGVGVEFFVLRTTRNLLSAAEQVRAGNLAARTGMTPSREELSQIGHAFDDMAEALQDRDQRLQHALHEMQQQAITDALTKLLNRRYLVEYLPPELSKAKRRGSSVAVIMVDADHFKRINDTFGHDAGDLVLRELATLLKSNVRAGDVAVRWGGEEFLLVLPESTVRGARDKAAAIRAAITQLALVYEGKPLGNLSASLGVAVFPHHGDTAEELIRAADEALYRAKESGRNRVVLAPTAPELLEDAPPPR